MKEAMEMCGLDGDKYGRVYELSKWVKTDIKDTTLDLTEFQTIFKSSLAPEATSSKSRRLYGKTQPRVCI